MQIPENIQELIEKYQNGTASPADIKRLNEWYHSFDDGSAELQAGELTDEKQLSEKIGVRIMATIRQDNKPAVPQLRRRWWIPAAAVLLLAAGTWMVFLNQPADKKIARSVPGNIPVKNDIAPGGNKAVLILADGSSVILDSASNGIISRQGNTSIQKLDNGLLAYTVNGRVVTENDEAFYNTITTPRGGQYQVTLSDGTKVWLNAASSIRFPVVFTGAERNVEMSGEVYFEVAKNKDKPFKVKAAVSEIEVLGTHFNVNAYTDEPAIRTTLLEGLVKVTVPSSRGAQPARFLQPGQQSGITKEGQIEIINNADTEEALAWKNGRFQFKSADLKSILRQIARWYDVDVEYRGNVNLHFTGQLTRNDNVSKVFEKLALTGEVQFKLEGKKIIVSHK